MRLSLFVLMVLFLSCRSNLFAQPYYQLLKNDRHWIYTQMVSGEEPAIHIVTGYALSIQGDTLLQGNEYKKVYQHTLRLNDAATAIHHPKEILDTHLYALMREDAGERKVYLLPFQDTISMCEPTEHLLYDFSLQVGDTLNDCVLENLYEPFMTNVPRVDSIRQEIHFGLETRAFYTQGVFINEGLLADIQGRLLEGFGYEQHGLINYGRKGPLVRFVEFCEGDSFECEFLSSIQETPDIPQPVFTVSPNPAGNVLIIQMDPAFWTGTELQVHLLNAVGNSILHANCNTVEEVAIDVRHIHGGIYFLNIYGERIRAVEKIVIAD